MQMSAVVHSIVFENPLDAVTGIKPGCITLPLLFTDK